MKGKYEATPEDWQFAVAESGTEYVLVRFRIDSTGDHAYWRGFFTDKTWQRTIESLQHCGWDGVELSTLDDMAAMNGMGTKSVELVLEEEEYKGELRTKVAWVNPLGGKPMAVKSALEGDARRRFMAKMQARIDATSPNPATKPEPKKKPDPMDDIPF